MYIERVPNRKSPPCVLLRESYREDGKVKTRTLANLTHVPEHVVEALRAFLKGGTVIGPDGDFDVVRSLAHGHVYAVLEVLKDLGLVSLIDRRHSRARQLVLAMIVERIVGPASKLAFTRRWGEDTASDSLGEVLDVSEADEDELYEAMDWLLPHQARIERALARRHLGNGALVLYDVTSTYFEGRGCPLARLGHNRDGKKGKLQIVIGLLCDIEGRPIAVEVFEGNTGDPTTLATQITKVRERFSLERVILVGDRGMITEARIREELRPVEGLDWISALRAPALRTLVEQGAIQPSLFDDWGLAEVTSPEYPGERLIVCYNPLLAAERTRKRTDLLAATQAELERLVAATQRSRRPLRSREAIQRRSNRALDRFKMRKHFQVTIDEGVFSYERDLNSIAQEAALDGLYVVRTSVPAEVLDAEQTVAAYKGLSVAERAFRTMKTMDLKIRPIHHRDPDRVRAHVFLCMLAYYVEWEMRQRLATVLFDEDDHEDAASRRETPVHPATRSARAEVKAREKRTPEGWPVLSFRSLLEALTSITRNRIQTAVPGAPLLTKTTIPTLFQRHLFDLLRIPIPR